MCLRTPCEFIEIHCSLDYYSLPVLVIAVHARGEQDPFMYEFTQQQDISSLFRVSTSQPGWDQNMCKSVCVEENAY
jgi:hypothetical protein